MRSVSLYACLLIMLLLWSTGAVAASQASQIFNANQMHPDIEANKNRTKDMYLNPQFRYAGPSATDESRTSSQRLDYSAVSMDVGDLTGDGRNEVVVLGTSAINIYRFDKKQMILLASHNLPKANRTLLVRIINRNIIVNSVDTKGLAKTSLFAFKGNAIVPVLENQRWFLNVVKFGPSFTPTLIGQKSTANKIFGPGVYKMQINDGSLMEIERPSLPASANVFNFAHLPGNGSREGDKIVIITDKERLRTHTLAGGRVAETDDVYSGAAIGFEMPDVVAGFGRDSLTQGDTYYLPMRMMPMDLEGDGNFELLVNKPISTAASIFDRYRFYPQSEIHSLFWDGVGLNLQWKTRRIKGSTVDFTVADADNNGVNDLVVCINTHPGAPGADSRRAIVLLYPLDTSPVDTSTAPYVNHANE